VAEAVIRACKTRTRPIVITALALVAGSSVIFTDPIFQGMAISLSSGVLVSTILTLIVIPLGCVAASRDLCEVAVASAPPGTVVPCAQELLGDDGADPRTATPQRRAEQAPALLSQVGSVMMMAFYLVRAPLLLLYDGLQSKLRQRRQRQTSGAGELRNALRTGAASSPAAAAADSTAQQASAEAAVTASAAPANSPAAPRAAAKPETAAKKATAKKAVAKKAVAKKAASGAVATKKTAAKKTTAAKPQQPASGAVQPQSATVPKKAGRRGIRLKTDDDE
jgi:hypothetical protein